MPKNRKIQVSKNIKILKLNNNKIFILILHNKVLIIKNSKI